MILNKILESYKTFSSKQKKIADFLINNKTEAAFMSLKELSKTVQVSEVTILNFCKLIDLENYIDLKKALRDELNEKLEDMDEEEASLEECDDLQILLKRSIDVQRHNYEKMIQDNSLEDLKKAAKLILEAENIYVCAQGISTIFADCLVSRLSVIDIKSENLNIGDIVHTSSQLMHATEKDLFIVITFPTYSQKVISTAKFAHEQGFKVLAITDKGCLKLSEYSNFILEVNNKSLILPNLLSSTISLIELLIIVLSFEMKSEVVSYLNRLENVRGMLSDIIK